MIKRSLRFVHWVLYALFFLMPLTFLPWTTSVFEMPKQYVLVVFTSAVFILWIGSMVVHKRLQVQASVFNLLPGLYLIATIISGCLGIFWYQSWFGHVSLEYTSLLSLGSLTVLFYVLMNVAQEISVRLRLMYALLISGALSSVLCVLNVLGMFHLPFVVAKESGFNTIGTINGFIGFMMVLMIMGLSLWLVDKKGEGQFLPKGILGWGIRCAIVVLSLATLMVSIGVDFWLFWVVQCVALVFVCAPVFIKPKTFVHHKRLILPCVIAFVSLVFLFVSTPTRFGLPLVVSPSYATSWHIAKQTLGSGVKPFLFGSGPGTFSFQYDLYKPLAVNQTLFWNSHFDRAKSHVFTLLTTTGVIPTLLWVVLFFALAFGGLRVLLRERDLDQWRITYSLFVPFLVILLLHLFYASNGTSLFLLFTLGGLLASVLAKKSVESRFDHSPRFGLVCSFFLVAVVIGSGVILLFLSQRLLAERAFFQARAFGEQGEPVELILEKMQRAVQLNPFSDRYQRNLSAALLAKTKEFVRTQDVANDQAARERVEQWVQTSVAAAAESTQLSPTNVENWSHRGNVYRDLLFIAQDADQFALATYQRAMEREPINPRYPTQFARVLLELSERSRASAQALSQKETPEYQAFLKTEQEQLSQAKSILEKAIEKKNDYLPAHYYLAAVYERQGEGAEALARLSALSVARPSDVGIGLEYALLLLRQEKDQEAISVLERFLVLAPEQPNVAWYLATAYERNGKKQEALEILDALILRFPQNEALREQRERMYLNQEQEILPHPVEEEGERI